MSDVLETMATCVVVAVLVVLASVWSGVLVIWFMDVLRKGGRQ